MTQMDINAEPRAPVAEPPHFATREACAPFALIQRPIWVFDVERYGVWWANPAGLRFWRAETLADLQARRFDTDNAAVKAHLRILLETASLAPPAIETWTLYPAGEPTVVRIAFTTVRIGRDGRAALVIEALNHGAEAEDREGLRLAEATRYMSIMVSAFDLKGGLIAMNPAATGVYGRAGAVPSGRAGECDFVRRFADRVAAEALLQATADHEDHAIERQMETRSGLRWHKLELRRSRDPVSGDQIILLVEDDVTDKRNALTALETLNQTLEERVRLRTTDLQTAMKKAEAANETKSEFLARMSHDLRTPLNAILGFSEFLTADETAEIARTRHRDYGRFINDAAQSLLALVDDLLDLSRIEVGQHPIRLRPIDVADVVHRTMNMLTHEFERKEIALLMEFRAAPKAVSDAKAISQILANLLSNALKFTPRGGEVTVGLREETDADTGRAVFAISVRDSGVGITEGEARMAFEPYARGRAELARVTEGTGLGLAICRRLADLLGGALTLGPAAPRGAEAVLRLPMESRPPA